MFQAFKKCRNNYYNELQEIAIDKLTHSKRKLFQRNLKNLMISKNNYVFVGKNGIIWRPSTLTHRSYHCYLLEFNVIFQILKKHRIKIYNELKTIDID